MGAYMAESFKDLHVGSDIEQLFRYIEDYKPVHLDLEDSGTNLWAAAVAIASSRKFKAQSSSLVMRCNASAGREGVCIDTGHFFHTSPAQGLVF